MAQRQFRSDDTSIWLDKYGLGTDGTKTVSSNQDYDGANAGCSGSGSSTTLSLDSASSFADGDLILIHQTRGVNAGEWELNKITSGGGTTTLSLAYPLIISYTDSGNEQSQVVELKQYTNVTVNGGTTWSAPAWDGNKGGIIAFLATGTVTVTGTISTTGRGFLAGTSTGGTGNRGEGTNGPRNTAQITNNGNGAGGGGKGTDSGHIEGGHGGGGGNSSTGTSASTRNTGAGGQGGTSIGNAGLTQMTFGGAGGSGGGGWSGESSAAGGNGAGIVFIAGRTSITVTGSIQANGNSGGGSSTNGGAGGGGAGGNILLKTKVGTLGSSLVTASAGSGGTCTGAFGGTGGAGSTGRIHIDYATSFSGTSSPTIDPRQDILMGDTLQALSVKASIIVKGNHPLNVVGNVRKNNNTSNNSAKANFIKNRGIHFNAVVGSILSGEFKKKRYGYKLYYSATDIRDVWGNEVVSQPSFRTSVNSGPGELVVRLARRFDAFGEGEDLVLNRKVDVYVYDRDEPQGALLYQGFISSYSPVLDGTKEYIEVVILGYSVEIGQRILKDGAGNTTLDYTSEDPSDIMRDVIDKYIADTGSLTYDSESIDDTGTTVSYRFANYTVKESLDKIIELTPFDWYWRIDPNGKIYLKQQSESADHRIYIGKHISYMKPERSLEDVRNVVYFVGGTPEGEPQLYRKYTRSASVSLWGLREIVLSDSRVTLDTTADTKAERFLDAHENPDVRTVIRIMDNNGQNSGIGYDIESVHPGDTISIENLKTSQKQTTLWDQAQWDSSNWDFEIDAISSDILHVINVNYTPYQIEVEAARALPVVAKRIEDIDRNVNDLQTTDLPVAPTVA